MQNIKEESQSSSSDSDYMNFSEIQDMEIDLSKIGSIKDETTSSVYTKELEGCHKIDFNILKFSRAINRNKVLPVLTIKFLSDLDLMRIVN